MNQGSEPTSNQQDESLLDTCQKILSRCDLSLVSGGQCLAIVAKTESDYVTLLHRALYEVAKEAYRRGARWVRITIEDHCFAPRVLLVSTLLYLNQLELGGKEERIRR